MGLSEPRGRRSRRVQATAVAAGVLVLGVAASALAVQVQGSLQIPADLGRPADESAEGPPSHYWEQWNGFIDPVAWHLDVRREIAVVLTGSPEGDPVGCEYALFGGTLMPSTMAARAGGTLRIQNTDPFPHELYSEGIEDFAPLSTAPGNARSHRVQAAGHFEIRDRLYEHVVGHLHVLPDLVACGQVQPDGKFSFDVPAGNYTVKVLFRDRELASQPVEVAEGRELTLDPIALTAGGGGQ